MSKLFLIYEGRFPSEKAAALFAAKSAEAFAEHDLETHLIVPRRAGRESTDAYTFYRLPHSFHIHFLPTIDLFFIPGFAKVAFYVHQLTFSFASAIYLFFKSKKEDLIYSNETLPLLGATFFRNHTFYEAHELPRQKIGFYSALFRRVRGIIVTNTWKRDQLITQFSLNPNHLLCELNAVDLNEFSPSFSKEEARVKLGLPTDKRIILYTGHLYSWKGVDTLAEAASCLSAHTMIYFVGGTTEDLVRFRALHGKQSNIVIVGQRPHREIPIWQRAADVLVAPNTAKEAISKYDTSPMKIFEYMASGGAIVSTDIPSIREILNETNALIVPADDSHALARGITTLLNHPDQAQRLAEKAAQDVADHTWTKRAGRILHFIKNLT